jgi:hypothetical protein
MNTAPDTPAPERTGYLSTDPGWPAAQGGLTITANLNGASR